MSEVTSQQRMSADTLRVQVLAGKRAHYETLTVSMDVLADVLSLIDAFAPPIPTPAVSIVQIHGHPAVYPELVPDSKRACGFRIDRVVVIEQSLPPGEPPSAKVATIEETREFWAAESREDDNRDF